MAKVLVLNGSPRASGCTATALNEIIVTLEREGIETELIQVGKKNTRGCIACGSCRESGKCIFNDLVNEVAPKFESADGLVIGSPVYYGSPNGALLSFLDRLFYSNHADLTMKVGAAVTIARRGGCSCTFDELNKYFTISGMPVASSQYWNMAYGRAKGEAAEDGEGMRTMRVLAENMSFLMKSIALGKEKYGLPEKEDRIFTNFIRSL